ncbi:MAG TPA: alpha-ketoacid dehydrogenase subunit beta [Anaerolineae bacterium]|nr:alpha-ketoacid dehydrogenase subunit beta [Anaerolineae bacterium]
MSTPNRQLTIAQAIREALREEMLRDPEVFLMGEEVAGHGGVFQVTVGLLDEFGPERVTDTPISEAIIVGAGIGAAMLGMRPVVEIMFGDFSMLAMDQIVNQAAKLRYMSGGRISVPLTIRTTLGAGRSSAAQHSQSLQAIFAHIPGLKVVLPSTPYDAKGLLKTAIRDPDPVIFIEDKMSYSEKGNVPEEEYLIPFGVADIKRHGKDITVIATSSMVPVALAATDTLAQQGVDAEVIDPRTLVPLDAQTLITSVKKTGRAIIVDEGCLGYGATAELASVVAEGAFDYLQAPVKRLGAMNVPLPYSHPLESVIIPTSKQIVEHALALLA